MGEMTKMLSDIDQQIEELVAENVRLKEENARLKSELHHGLLHAYSKQGSYPCIYVTVSNEDDDEDPVVIVEYNKEDGKIHVTTYEDEENPLDYALPTDYREVAAQCRKDIDEMNKTLDEAYSHEDPEEFITLSEEIEIKSQLEQTESFLKTLNELTGECSE